MMAIDHRIVASVAGEHQVFVERRFQGAGVGSAQHGIARLDVVRDAQARFGLAGAGDAVVDVAAKTEIEAPVLERDGVLDVQAEFVDVGVAADSVQPAGEMGQPSEPAAPGRVKS